MSEKGAEYRVMQRVLDQILAGAEPDPLAAAPPPAQPATHIVVNGGIAVINIAPVGSQTIPSV